MHWNQQVLDLSNLIEIARGDNERMEKYLRQFQELIPGRIKKLQQSLSQEERKSIRQILHQMSPQLQFFGIPEVIIHIRRLELEYETMPIADLTKLVHNLVCRLNAASEEVENILVQHF